MAWPRLPALRPRAVCLAALVPLSIGCSVSPPRARLPEVPTEQARCRVAGGNANPLVTEWSASEKANLEVSLQEGGVVAAYSGCELRVLRNCTVGGTYQWLRTTTMSDAFEMRSADDLYARLPIGAASLEGTLAQAGQLTMRTTVAGQMKLTRAATLRGPGCAGATHVVTGVSVGAFRLTSRGSRRAGVGVNAPVVELGGKAAQREALVREAGDPKRCAAATDTAADPNCGSPIQLFLAPVARPVAGAWPSRAPTYPAPTYPAPTARRPPAPAPAAAPALPSAPPRAPAPPPQPPPPAAPAPEPRATPNPSAQPWLPPAPAGPLRLPPVNPSPQPRGDGVPTIKVSLSSAEPAATFLLSAGGKGLCTSPCKHTVRVDDLVTVMELRDGKPKEMSVDDLRRYASFGRVDVLATPRSPSARVGGVVLTGVGGAGFLGGIITMFIGGRERNEQTREVEPNVGAMIAGGVLLGLSAAAVPTGIVLLTGSRQRLEVRPPQGLTLSLGPTGLTGSF